MARKPAEEMALSFSSSRSPGVPTETDAKDRGIALREVRDTDIFGVI
jgi:hypothetical protein